MSTAEPPANMIGRPAYGVDVKKKLQCSVISIVAVSIKGFSTAVS